MYHLLEKLLPYSKAYSHYISIVLFFIWLIQKNSKLYLKYLEHKAKRFYDKQLIEIHKYNLQNPNNQFSIKTSWYDLYNSFYKKINNKLLLSFVFAYISFNTESFAVNDSEMSFKLLTISTTLLLAGLAYIRE